MFKGLKCLPISATLLCCASSFIPLAKGANLIPVSSDGIELQKAIKGVVKDKEGNPIVGATVALKFKPSIAVSTDAKGNFSLTGVNVGELLIVRSVGYLSKEVMAIADMAITLEDENARIDEVVVVGYGTQKKESVTGAITAISSQDISRSVATTTSGALVGKIAGVNSRMSDGRPGAATGISIRNMGTPLYVIDGVQKDEGQFNNLDFNDIESVSVLKDASAAIYGVRAANGVVVVTTKKGKRGDNNTFNINSYYGWQSMFRFPKPADASTYIKSYIQSDAILGTEHPQYTLADLEKWQQGTEKGYRPFDWYDYILKTSPQTYISGNVSGGSEKINYYLSVGHLDQQSIIRNYGGFNRTNVQMNIDANVSKRLKIGANLNGRIEQRKQPGVPGADDTWQALFAIYRNLPTARPFANDNPLYPTQTSPNAETNFAMLNYDLSGTFQEKWRVMQLNFNAEYKITNDLIAKGTVGYYLANKWMDNQEFTYKLYGYDEKTDTYPVTFSMDNPWRERSISQVEEISTQFTLNYNKRFGRHGINAVLAAESIKRDNPDVYVHDRPASNALSLIYFQTMDTYNDTGVNTQARAGFAGRVNYDYDQKYLLELSSRYDGSWKFAPGSRWGFFPSASAGWRISSEKFWSEGMKKVLDDVKLRGSYGVLGDDNLDAWDYFAFGYLSGYNYFRKPVRDGYQNIVGSTIDGKYVIGSQARGLPVKTLSWIQAHMLNVGLDFSTLKGKLTGSVDLFRRKRTGLPAKREDVLIPNEVGFSLPYENLNSDIHQGIDGSLMWRSSVNGFNYFVGGNFTFARQTDGEQYKPRFGNSLDQYRKSIYDRYAFLNWGLHSIGQFQSWEEIANYDIDNDRKGNSSLRPGDIKYEDINGDKVINELDERPIGYRQGGLPYFNYGINLGGQFKGFDLAMDFTGAAFASFNPSYEAVFPFHDGGNNPQYYMENQWMLSDITNPNSALIPGKYPTLIKGNRDHSNYWHSDFWLTNVNYLKLRNLQIGYTLPEKWMKPRGIQKLRVYTMMQNLFSIDNLGDMKIDPEITSDSGVQYPTNRVINVGVTLTF